MDQNTLDKKSPFDICPEGHLSQAFFGLNKTYLLCVNYDIQFKSILEHFGTI